MTISRRAASSSAPSAAEAGARAVPNDGAQRGFRLHVRRANLAGNKVARLAAARPVATQELAAARAELRDRASKMRAAAGELAHDVCSEAGQALALLALLDSDRGLLALRAFCTLVADARGARGSTDDSAELGLLLRARPAGANGDHLEVPLTTARAGIKLSRLALADYPWSDVRAKIRGEALPALFPLGDAWAGVPPRLAGQVWLADVGCALAEFRDGGKLPARLRLPLYAAAGELRERCGLHWFGDAMQPGVPSAGGVLASDGREAAQSDRPTSPLPPRELRAAPPAGPSVGEAVVGLGISLPAGHASPPLAQVPPPACAPADEEVQQEAAGLFSSQLTLRPSASQPDLSPPRNLVWYEDDNDDALPPLPAEWALPPASLASRAKGATPPASPPHPPQTLAALWAPSPEKEASPAPAKGSEAASPVEADPAETADELVFPTLLTYAPRAPEAVLSPQTDVSLDVSSPASTGLLSAASRPSSASEASAAEERGRSPTSQARLWHEAPRPVAPVTDPGLALSPSGAPPRTLTSPSRASSPALSSYSLPSSVPMSSRENSQASQRSGSPLGFAAWAAPLRGRSNLAPTPGSRSPHSSEASAVDSPPVWTPAPSSVTGISDEDWAEAAVQPVTPAPEGPVSAVASTAVSAAGWGLGVLRSWVRVGSEVDAARGVQLGAAEGGHAAGAAEVAPVRAASLVADFRARASAQSADRAVGEQDGATLGRALLDYVEAGGTPEARRARCIEVLGELADDELAAAWAFLPRLPTDVAEAVGSSFGARLLRHPPARIDDAACALAAAWLRRLGASPSAAATLWHADEELDARRAGEAIGQLEKSMDTWCAEPSLLTPVGRVLAASGEAAPQAQRTQWVRAAAAGDGGPLVDTLRQVAVGSPLLLCALTQLAQPYAVGSAAARDATVALAVEKFASKRNAPAPAKAKFQKALTTLVGQQKRGWARLEWSQAVAWRLYEVASPADQAGALEAAMAAAATKGTAPSTFLVQTTQFVGPGVQLQLAARLVAAHAADVALAEATAKVIARVHRQQAAAPGTLRQRDAAAVAALAYVCGVMPDAWHGRQRDAGLVIWRALNGAEFLLTACLASGFTAEAADVVHDALATPTLTPTALWGATTALAALVSADGQRPGVRLVAAVTRRADEAERDSDAHAQAFPRRRTLPAELQKLAERLSTSGAAERRQEAWRATAKRLTATHEQMRRFAAVLATQVAGHLARAPLPPQTPQGRATARDWTEAMVGLVEARQRAFPWMGTEPPLQALRERLRTFADAYALVDTRVGDAMFPNAPLSPEAARARTFRHLPTLAAFVDAAPEATLPSLLEGLIPALYFGHDAYFAAKSLSATQDAVDSLRLTAWQGMSMFMPAYWLAARRLGAKDGYASLKRYQYEAVKQLAAESSLGLQGERMRYLVDRSLRLTRGDASAQAAVKQGTIDGLREAFAAYTDWSVARACGWRMQEVLRLGWALATHDAAHTEFAVELLQMVLLMAHGTPSGAAIVQSVGHMLSDDGMGIDPAELSEDEARLQTGLRQAVAMYVSADDSAAAAPYLRALTLGVTDWREPARQDGWTLAQSAWAEAMAPGELGANYRRLAQAFPPGSNYQEAVKKEEMQYVDYAMLDADTRRELLEALVDAGELAPALNDGLLGRMAYWRPLSPSEQALAEQVAGYAGPYANVAQVPLEAPLA